MNLLQGPQRQFNHFSHPHLLLIVSYVIVYILLILSIDWFTFSVKQGIGGDNAEFRRFGGYNFELDGLEAAPDDEEVTFLDRTVKIAEIGVEVGLGEITGNPLDGVGER